MSNPRVFTSQNNYAKLEEAIIADENDDTEYDVLLLPPDLAVVSDEEEGNDDDLTSTTFPKDVPGRVEVISRRQNHDISDWDESDEEPLSNQAGPSKRPRNLNSNNPSWRKTQPVYTMSMEVATTFRTGKKTL